MSLRNKSPDWPLLKRIVMFPITLAPYCTAAPPLTLHYETRTVGKRAVGILLECMAGDVRSRGGHAWQGCVCVARMPPCQILRDTVNERAVRILLECILVYDLCSSLMAVMISPWICFWSG